MATAEASTRPVAGTSTYASTPPRNNLSEIHSNSLEERFTGMRRPPYPPSHRFSMSSNLSGHFASNIPGSSNRSRSHSKADSISTLWSSAEVPLFLDTRMERSESAGSHRNIGPSKMMFSGFTPMRSSSNEGQGIVDDNDEREELSNVEFLTDGPRSVSSPRSSIASQHTTPHKEPHRQQTRPPPLTLHRDTAASGVPSSVSLSSSHMLTPGQSSLSTSIKIVDTSKPAPLPPPPHLYQNAERFFSLSYTMTPPSSADPSADSFEGQQDDGLQQSPVKALSPSYSFSRDSRSSTDSSSVLPDTESFNNRLCAMATMTKSISHEDMPSSPLRVAVGLTADNAYNRPHTSLATLNAGSPRTKSPAELHFNINSGREASRQCKDGEETKYSFLDSPAPSISGRKSSASGRKLSLFNAKLKTSSTPKLRAEKQLADNLEGQEVDKEQREATSRSYPPQAPSGRYRSRTLGESELIDPLTGVSAKADSTHRASQDSQRPSRRPSLSDPLSAVAARLRRPSKALTISSSHYNSSSTSVNNLNEGYEAGPSRTDRACSTTSSQFFVDSSGHRNTSVSTFLKKAASTAPAQTKSKGGWASHLTQGLTLHIEQGSRRFTIKMNYLSYDPFGKPESLCKDRPVTPSRPKSKNGVQQEEDISCNDSVGLLEFDPQIETEGSTTADRLTLDATTDAPILKHLVIGNDIKGDLITRQANLSLGNIGTREVSGSERKGKVTWRFVYGVENCRLDSGEVVTGMKTLRPLSFTCSATLLDPSRAKKSRMINIIKKQIGSNIESMPMPTARNDSITSSTHPQSLPALGSPTSSQCSSQQGSPSQRAYSPVTSSNPAHSPSRVGLTPFKMTRPMIEAISARNRQNGELSPSSCSLAPSSPRGATSFLTRKSSLLPSPLSCNFQGDRSPKAYVPGGRLLAPHQIKTRPRGSSVGKEAKSALGLDIGEPQSTPRKIRPSTSQGELKRPTTASEEIKQAYLMQSSLQSVGRTQATSTCAQQQQQHYNTFPASSNMKSPQYSPTHSQYQNLSSSHQTRRPSITNQTAASSSSATVVQLECTRQPSVSSRQRRQAPANTVSTAAGPPEGPFWL